ncbi:MAG: MFS transporter [Clostridia bacterium]|nr:MFS transporter [Clostridia bacterium]
MSSITKAKLVLAIRLFGESLFMPYISLFLLGKGFTQSEIGIIIGLIPLTSLACAPVYSKIFNTPKKAKNALAVMSAIECLLVIALMFLSNSLAVVITIIVAISIVTSSNYGLLDSLLGLICTQNGKTFGSVRIYGAISYLIGSLCAGLLTKATSYELIFSITVAVYVLVSVTFIFIKAPVPADTQTERTVTVKSVLCDKRFMAYVLFYVLFIGCMQVCDDFYSLYLVSKGNPDYYYSYVMLGFVGVEIITMFLMNRFAKPELKYLFIACGVLCVRTIIQSIPALPTWALIASQVSRGIIWGITLYVSTPYIIKLLGFERSTTGIVLCTFFLSVFTCIFKLCGGYIISAIGYSYFYMIFAVISVADLFYLAVYARSTAKLKLPEEIDRPHS